MRKLLFIFFIVIESITKQSHAQIITSVVGTYTWGYTGDGGQATNAEIDVPWDLRFDAVGNLYFSDADNNRIRKVNTTGIITTVVGSGSCCGSLGGYSGDGGQATAATLNYPTGIAFDVYGNLYISDMNNNRIRMVNTAGIITTVAGNGTGAGNTSCSTCFGGDGGPATAAEINQPYGITFDALGNMYIADYGNGRVRIVNTSGIINTFAGGGYTGTGDGGQATAAELGAMGIAFDATGNLYITEFDVWDVRKVSTTGIITTIVNNARIQGHSGDGGPATAAELNYTTGVSFDAIGNLYIADYDNYRIRQINTIGIITTVAGGGIDNYLGVPATSVNIGNPVNIAFDALGNMYSTISPSGIFMISAPLTVAVNSSTVCAGSSTTLTASGANTYSWSPATGLSTTTGSMVIASPTVSTTYTVTGTSVNTIFNTAATSLGTSTTLVTVLPSPALAVNNPSICTGASTTLTASGANNYTWSSNAGSVNTTTVNVSPSSTTIYTIIGSVGICSLSETSTVTVFNSTNINLSSATFSICNGSSQTFSVNGASTYTWAPATTLTNPNIANTIANPTTTTVYSVTGTNACGTSTPLTLTLTINPNPVITVNSPSICVGATATLTAGGANTYTWNTGVIAATTTVAPAVSKNYTVTGTDVNNCVNSAISAVTSVPTPTVTWVGSSSHDDSLTFCADYYYSNNYLFFSNPAGTINWTNNNTAIGLPASGSSTGGISFYTASVSTQTTATLTVNSTSTVGGCTSTSSTDLTIKIIINPLPIVTFSMNPNTFCINSPSVALTGTPSGGGFSGTGICGTGHQFCPSLASIGSNAVQYLYQNANGCRNTATVYAIVNPLPTISAVSGADSLCIGNTATLTASGANTYTWSTGAVGQSVAITPTVNTTYSVTGTDGNGCINTDTITQVVKNCYTTGIIKLANGNDIAIYPNPNNGSFVIEPSSTTKQTMQVYDVNGKLVLTQTINGKTTIDASSLNEGVYNVSLLSNEGVINKRLVIVR